MKELTLNSLNFERGWWSWKNWFWTVSTLRGCGGYERTDFEQFLLWEGVVVLKELIWTVSTLRGCGGYKRTDFEQFLIWEGVVVYERTDLNSLNFGRMWWSWKNWFWTVSTLRGCGGHERTDFEQFLLWRGCGVPERTDFEQFLLWEGVVVKKELIFNSFYFGRVWWSWKNWFWTVSTLGGCGGYERTHLNSFYFERMWILKELIFE